MSKPSVQTANILKFSGTESILQEDLLAVEDPLEIRLGFGQQFDRQQIKVAVTMRTPGHDFELALGFLFTEGIIQSVDDIKAIQFCTELNSSEQQFNVVRVELKENVVFSTQKLQRNFYTTSSCGVCGKASIEAVFQNCQVIPDSKFQVSAKLFNQLPETLKNQQHVFAYTGGLHGCALFDPNGNLHLLREDVGRHNALDKLIGATLGSNQNLFSGCILLLSGRASFELIQKAAMAGIPIIAAVGAPSSLAVETAKAAGITLIGFLRENRFNIYCGEERIKD